MTKVSRLDLSTFPDSPYAQELQRDLAKLRFFRPQLEMEYQQSQLLSSRRLIRVACAFAFVLTLARGAELLYADTWDSLLLIELCVVMGCSLALAVISWGSAFERLYLRWARIVVPLRNSLIAVQIAVAAAHGQSEILMALPILLIGPFFFLGLPFRGSLFCGGVTVVSYVAAANTLGLPHLVALHSYVLLGCGVVACVIAVWHLEKVSRQLFLESQLIAELATRDSLTGTKNRRVFDEHLELLWQQAIANERAMAILLIDIDHFKDYNDFYGHQAGDLALRQVAQTIQKMVRRPRDILTRYGGEEFAVILYDVDAPEARDSADRIRAVVGELNIEHRASRPFSRVTVSIGVAVIEPTAERSPHGAVQLADQALYEAKRQGRNRVELMDSTQHAVLETGVFAMAAPVTHIPSTNQARAASSARPAQSRRGLGG